MVLRVLKMSRTVGGYAEFCGFRGLPRNKVCYCIAGQIRQLGACMGVAPKYNNLAHVFVATRGRIQHIFLSSPVLRSVTRHISAAPETLTTVDHSLGLWAARHARASRHVVVARRGI